MSKTNQKQEQSLNVEEETQLKEIPCRWYGATKVHLLLYRGEITRVVCAMRSQDGLCRSPNRKGTRCYIKED